MSQKRIPCLASSSRLRWYTTSDSYCAVTPARYWRSASGMPSFSYVAFICSGSSSHSSTWSPDGPEVVVDVLEVDVGHVHGEPLAIGLRSNGLQGPQAHLGHPPRLALPPRDLLDDPLVDALRRREGVLDLVAPAQLVLGEIQIERRHASLPTGRGLRRISTTAIVTIRRPVRPPAGRAGFRRLEQRGAGALDGCAGLRDRVRDTRRCGRHAQRRDAGPRRGRSRHRGDGDVHDRLPRRRRARPHRVRLRQLGPRYAGRRPCVELDVLRRATSSVLPGDATNVDRGDRRRAARDHPRLGGGAPAGRDRLRNEPRLRGAPRHGRHVRPAGLPAPRPRAVAGQRGVRRLRRLGLRRPRRRRPCASSPRPRPRSRCPSWTTARYPMPEVVDRSATRPSTPSPASPSPTSSPSS